MGGDRAVCARLVCGQPDQVCPLPQAGGAVVEAVVAARLAVEALTPG
jgi:hypothetical protein